jgi:hypothetical protein
LAAAMHGYRENKRGGRSRPSNPADPTGPLLRR